MKTATSLTLVRSAPSSPSRSPPIAFLNLQVTGWVFILTGVAGAIVGRSSWLRRTLAGKRHQPAPQGCHHGPFGAMIFIYLAAGGSGGSHLQYAGAAPFPGLRALERLAAPSFMP
jgi:hypothetical protein